MSDMTFGDWSREAARAVLSPSRSHWTRLLVLGAALIASAVVVFLGAAIAAALAAAPKPIASPHAVADIAMAPVAPGSRSPTIRPPGAATWVEIIKPIQIFSLEAAELATAPRNYAAKRNTVDGGRRDVISLGVLAGDEPAMRLSLYRRDRAPAGTAPIFADMTRLAAETGLSVTRSGLPDLLPTRFGAFEVVALGLAHGQKPAVSCSGFRLTATAPALTIDGLACGGSKTLTRDRLGCLLDRIDLAAGGGDRPLVEFFASSELRRNTACEGARLGPGTVHAAWLDDRPATPAKIRRRHLGNDTPSSRQ